jgi:hypothetical protein
MNCSANKMAAKHCLSVQCIVVDIVPLKEKQQDFTINWSILKREASYSSGGKRCNLCLQEKLCILKADKSNLLNRRRELFSKCVHQKRFLAGKFERAQAQSRTQTCSHASSTTDINVIKQEKLVEVEPQRKYIYIFTLWLNIHRRLKIV